MIRCASLFSGIGGFELGIQAASERYRCIGNSVTVPVVADIMEKILKVIKW